MLISVDHGNKLIKVLHHAPFTSGLQESDVPPFGGETLKYQGKYYTLSEKRIPYHRDKTEDDRFWILTLFAIAYEIEAVGGYSQNIIRIQSEGYPALEIGLDSLSVRELIAQSVEDLADEDGYAYLGDLGTLLIKKQPDFDARNYGFAKLSRFIAALDGFELDERHNANYQGTQVFVRNKK